MSRLFPSQKALVQQSAPTPSPSPPFGDAADAAAMLGEALDLWHGPALADVEAPRFAAAEAGEVQRRHVDALEERIDADRAGGGGPELVGELEGLVRKHPFRGRAVAALAVAL